MRDRQKQKIASVKFSQPNQSLQMTTDRIPTNVLLAIEVLLIVHMFPTAIAAEVTVTLVLFIWRRDVLK